MSDDPDFQKANHALQVLRQARLSRNEAAAIMLGELVYETAAAGLRTPEIEEARQAAWDAICALAKALRDEGFAPPALWKTALGATESWIELLDYRCGLDVRAQSRASRAEIDHLQGRHAISEAIRRFAFSAEPSRAARMLWRANQPTVRFDCETAMAQRATAPTRFRIRLRLRNHALVALIVDLLADSNSRIQRRTV